MQNNITKYFKVQGCIFCLCGPSGVGKSSIIKKVKELNPELKFSISCTTRNIRKGEVDGIDYYFLTKQQFEKKIEHNDFLEYACVHNNYYGTLTKELIEKTANGKDLILDIDIQGFLNIKETIKRDTTLAKKIVFIFIAPPKFSDLEARLNFRGTEDENSLIKRLETAKKELEHWQNFDYLIINDNLEKAIQHFNNIINLKFIKPQNLEPQNNWPLC